VAISRQPAEDASLVWMWLQTVRQVPATVLSYPAQVRRLREVAFQTKQRALREALAVGEQVARRRRVALVTACFMAWKVQVGGQG